MMVRWMCAMLLKDRKCSMDLYSLLGVQSMDEMVRWDRLPVEMWWWWGCGKREEDLIMNV